MLKRKILIVDDSMINRTILKKLLGDDYEIFEATNGKEALDTMNRCYKYLSAVLLDLAMPLMDGFEVLKVIGQNPILSQIPVIVITGSDDNDTEISTLSLGAQDFVGKPFNANIIKHRLKNVIRLRETAMTINTLKRDKLTGLLTREHFFEIATDMIHTRLPGYYVLTTLDINNFKSINDRFGNEAGDKVLTMIADTIKQQIAAQGGVCCRENADHFAMLYPADLISEDNLLLLIEEAARLNGQLSPITISAGQYIIDDLTLTVSTMLDRSHYALQTVKGRYDIHLAVFNEAMRAKLYKEQSVLNDMKTALADGQFEPWFQPQYDHSDGTLVGAEALVRWRHPEKGMISPADFIPVFERNGFIYELDKSVWRQTCALIRKWLDMGIDVVPVSVNISRYDTLSDDLVDTVVALTHEYDIPASLLRLEITESAFAESAERIVNVVNRFVKNGFTIEIDDFGSGYSSLNTLKDVLAQILKLDMKFLETNNPKKNGQSNSSRGGNILESVIRMTRWLNMDVIAEGVETVEQANYLSSIGCNIIQGYLYSRPVPSNEFGALLEQCKIKHQHIEFSAVEHLDNNEFWDPASLDTLIFNSFVGAACVLEYHHKKIEMLRANQYYQQMFNSITADTHNALLTDWAAYMDDENIRRFEEAINDSCKNHTLNTFEYEFHHLPGCPKTVFFRSGLRVIAQTDDRLLIYCITENITAQKAAEQNVSYTTSQLKAIIDNMNGGIVAVTGNNERTEYLLSNQQLFSLFGYTEEQFRSELADGLDGLFVDLNRSKHPTVDSWQNGNRFEIELRARKRDGTVFWVRCSHVVCQITGIDSPVYLIIFYDITDEKLTKLKLSDAEKQLHFQNELAVNLLKQPDKSSGICYLLNQLLIYFDCDSVRLLLENPDGSYRVVDKTDKDGYTPTVSVNPDNDFYKEIKSGNSVIINDSLLAAPVMGKSIPAGYVEVSGMKQNSDRIDVLTALTSYFTVLISR